ncbi:putative protein-like [Capsicum annuum]|nr:putative protein-like [Capsicum annuum]
MRIWSERIVRRKLIKWGNRQSESTRIDKETVDSLKAPPNYPRQLSNLNFRASDDHVTVHGSDSENSEEVEELNVIGGKWTMLSLLLISPQEKISAENTIASELPTVDPKRKIKKNQLNVAVDNNRTIPNLIFLTINLWKSLIIRTFKPSVPIATEPILTTSNSKDRDENPDPINKNQQQAWPKIPPIAYPPAPTVSHAMVTKLRAQEAMKVTTIEINPLLTTTKQICQHVAKVKVQIDLTKARPQHIWMGYDEDEMERGDGKLYNIYEDVPEYCSYYKHQGHTPVTCTMKRRDDEARKKKEMEEAEKHLKDQMHGWHPFPEILDVQMDSEIRITV